MPLKKSSKKFLLLLTAPFLVYACASAPYAVKFDEALKLKDYETAYSVIKEICGKTPQDAVCAKSEFVRKELAETRLARLRGRVEEEKKPVSIQKLEGFKKEADEAIALFAGVDGSLALKAVDKEMSASSARLAVLLKDAESAAASGNRKKAFDGYKAAFLIDGGVKARLDDYSGKAFDEAYAQGSKAAENDEWAKAHSSFDDAYYIKPDYSGLKERLDQATARDNGAYYMAEADSAMKAENYDRAILMYKGAAAYKQEGADAAGKLIAARVAAANAFFLNGLSMFESERPLSAALMFIKAKSFMADVPEDKRGSVRAPSRDISKLVKELYVKGASEAKAGNAEAAYLYMRAVSRLEPGYPEIASEKDRLKDEIRKRSMQSLAIIPFKGTSYSSDAGGVITSSILDFLYKELSKDVRILERGAIEALLKESEVKTFQGGEGAKGFLQLLGADYLLLGDVVNYKVESSVADMNKTVRAKTGSKKAPNPAFEDWKKRERGDPPPQIIDEPVYEDIRYKTTHYSKSGVITVSFRIVDSKGDVINTGLAEKKVEAEDDSAEGVEIGEFKVASKLAKIPTDTELLRTAQTNVVGLIGESLKKMFSNPEQRLMREMEEARKRSNYRAAVEKAVEAVFTLERKGMDTGAAEEKLAGLIVEGKF